MPKVSAVQVSRAESGQKLLQFLERRLKGQVPRSAIMRWIRTGQVRVDGGRKKPFDRLDQGQKVRIPPYQSADRSRSEAVSGSLEIVHEDDDMLVIAKPSGLSAHGGTGQADSVAHRLKSLYSDSDFIPVLVHRLDRDTSGLLLAAKTYEQLRRMNDLIRDGGLGKVYLAWVRGLWPGRGVEMLEDRLEKRGGPDREKVRAGSGKTALAQVLPLETADASSLLAVRLLTGRTHQIRVQLASRGCPVVGDVKYGHGGDTPMLLHACRLELPDRSFSLPPAWEGRWRVAESAFRILSRFGKVWPESENVDK